MTTHNHTSGPLQVPLTARFRSAADTSAITHVVTNQHNSARHSNHTRTNTPARAGRSNKRHDQSGPRTDTGRRLLVYVAPQREIGAQHRGAQHRGEQLPPRTLCRPSTARFAKRVAIYGGADRPPHSGRLAPSKTNAAHIWQPTQRATACGQTQRSNRNSGGTSTKRCASKGRYTATSGRRLLQ